MIAVIKRKCIDMHLWGFCPINFGDKLARANTNLMDIMKTMALLYHKFILRRITLEKAIKSIKADGLCRRA